MRKGCALEEAVGGGAAPPSFSVSWQWHSEQLGSII